jgi:hypothetical protein
LVTEVDKLTLKQKLTVWVPHSVLTLMENIGYRTPKWSNIKECYVKTCMSS